MSDIEKRLTELENKVGTLEDVNAIRRLHWAYGYYIDYNRPEEVAALFADDGAVVLWFAAADERLAFAASVAALAR